MGNLVGRRRNSTCRSTFSLINSSDMDLVLTNIHKYTPKRSDWAVDVDVDVEAGADVDVDDDDDDDEDDDEDDDDECVTCERLLIVSVVALVADIVSGIIDVVTFS